MEYLDEIITSIKNFNAFKGTIKIDEPMSSKTSFKVGGTAKLYIAPTNYYSFQIVLNVLNYYKAQFFILGGGTNIVFTDDCYDGAIVSTRDFADTLIMPLEDLPADFGKIELNKDQVLVTCFSGTSIASLVHFCTENAISGLEQFAGLPGTVGGAVYMNARCFDKSISDVLFSTSYMDYNPQKVTLEKCLFDKSQWDYKKSPFQNNKYFITTATFLLTQKSEEEKESISAECKKYILEREAKGHFKYPSAGSVFKNNRDFGAPSGKIIDDAGLKGYSIGGAQIAPFHGNIIINSNKAKAADIKQLVIYTQQIVKEKSGFLLEPEIIFVDNHM